MRRRGFAGSSPGAWRKVQTKNAAHAAARGGSLTSWPILPDSRPSVGRGVPPPEIGERAEKSSHSSLRGGSATKQSRAAPQTGLLRATCGARNDEPFSRRAFAPELCQATLRDRHHRALTRWSMLKSNKQSAGGSAARAYLPHGLPGLRPAMTKGNELKEIRRRNADRRNEYSAVANGHGRACKRQAHIYRRSTAVLVPRSLSSQGTQHQAFSSWDLAASLAVRRAGVTRPYLSQSSERSRAPVVVPRG